jgi:hypothetical protein
MTQQMSEKEELSEKDILFEIEDLLSSRRRAAYLHFWRAGAGNEYWYKALELVENYGNKRYQVGYDEGYQNGYEDAKEGRRYGGEL